MKSKSKMKMTVLLSLLLLSFLLVANQAAAENIKLGFIADVSGIGATIFKSQKAGLDLFIEEDNAKGGILGGKLELV
ncbi:MAG: ABC transporter substrate-binding protein, partial [Deltaproteobacteria bacterium]|nr:ABC transporter substrate-binding protein [Deltaproteobacteria bacterium]